jgi:hypothetical protein
MHDLSVLSLVEFSEKFTINSDIYTCRGGLIILKHLALCRVFGIVLLSMQPGFNTDIKHDGINYHVQTEDWGDSKSVLITRVYARGAVVKTVRTPYKEDENHQAIRLAMQRQHHEILDRLVSGKLL